MEIARRKPEYAWRGDENNFFESDEENYPWLRIQLNRKAIMNGLQIRNRINCCGERLENLEVRAGTKNDNTNEIVGRFAGPGVTNAIHYVKFDKWVEANFLTFQLNKKNAILQISKIMLWAT